MDNIEDIYELSPMQQGLLFHCLYEPELGVYFEQFCFTLAGNLNKNAFRKAWQQVVDRHAVLRTAFYWEELDKPVQVVHKSLELPWFEDDWSTLNPDEQQQHLETFLREDRAKGFDFNVAPLMRCTLIQLAENSYELIWSHHHILFDGWCLSIILQEVWQYYQAFCTQQPIYLETPHLYRDYIVWLQQQDLTQAEIFWREELKGFIAPTSLGIETFNPLSDRQKVTHEKQSLQLSSSLTNTLQALAQQNHLTLNILFQGAWSLLLSRYSGESDIVFGATVAGRPPVLPGIETMVGLFINTLPVRVQISEKETVLSWLQKLQEKQGEHEEYAYTPLVDIQRWSQIPRNTPLFDSLVAFENYPVDFQQWENNSLLKIVEVTPFEITNYTLSVEVIPRRELQISIDYNPQKIQGDIITRMLGHLKMILEAMVTNLNQPVTSLPFLTEEEKQQILYEWNNTDKDYDLESCIHQLIEKQVEKSPQSLAVIGENKTLTYEELNHRANQLAHYLQQLGVKNEVLVGICMERSLAMIIALLAILKAGGAYLPLDANYPQERLRYIIEDAQISILLTQEKLLAQFSNYAGQIISLEKEAQQISQQGRENLGLLVHPDNLAYMIYTSGSTGKPKGVMIEHRNVVNFIQAATETYEISQKDKILQFASLSFDVAVEEIYPGLSVGATLILLSPEMLMLPATLCEKCQEYGISLLDLPTAYWHQMVREMETSNWTMPASVRLVIIGGEKVNATLVRKWQERIPAQLQLINAYGPTETTVEATTYLIPSTVGNEKGEIPIGRGLKNVKTYVLNKNRQILPIGVIGELYIGGKGVGRGYWHQGDLTQERFILNPYGEDNSERLYQTGDLVRYREDGNLEYIGRIDNQIKIRGFRIELEEIENVLTQHPDVKEALVVIKEDLNNDKRLVAYIVSHLMPDRLPYHQQTSLEIEGQLYPLSVENFSPGGVGITDISPSIFIVGKSVNVYLVLPGESQQRCLKGKIAWQHYNHGGIEFSLNPAEKNDIEKSFQNLLKIGGFLQVKQRVLTNTMREYLKEKLPDYAIPGAFVLMSALPLTPNGKIDRRSLPESDLLTRNLDEAFVSPQTPNQETIAQIWTEVLKIQQIGINDNFFELGGHSLLATQVISRMREAFSLELPIKSLFEHPTVAQSAELIDNIILSRQLQSSAEQGGEGREEIEI